ncbi:MAG: hypothetical protein HQM13_19845 [SAR324 cluster bacterium]|nr:hypothetical protein [SAR324 cluster bacterium]
MESFFIDTAVMPESSEKTIPPVSSPSKEASSKKPAQTNNKVAKKFYPSAIQLIQSYDTVFKLSFLLNKKRCLMGSPKSGFSLNCVAIRKLRQLADAQKEFPFLPASSFHSENEDIKRRIYNILGQSVLEYLAEPIRSVSKKLLVSIESLDAEDESQENRVKIVQHFQKPINPGNAEDAQKSKTTPYMLLQQIQKSVALLRSRLLLELDTLHQLRRKVITDADCYHTLNASSAIEIKGRLLAAREIHQSLQGMRVLKNQKFSGEFHPKITLDRAIGNMEAWGPGTPPRVFHIKDDPQKGKTVLLNDKALEQLTILREATSAALGYEYRFSGTEKLIEKTEQELREYYKQLSTSEEENPDKKGTENSAPEEKTKKDSQTFQQKAKERLEQPASNAKKPDEGILSFDEILRFYADKRKENPQNYLAALYFETSNARFLQKKILTIAQTQDLRGIFTTLQMDISHAVDLYLVEAQEVIKRIKSLAKKLGVQPNSEELASIEQAGKQSQKLVFTKAIEQWTRNYISIVKKYVLIQKSVEEKLILEKAVPALCEMDASHAISYLEQLKSLLRAEEKGYISQEQKERYLDPEQTTDEELKRILAFFGAVEKFDFTGRCEEIAKGFRITLAHYEEVIEQDSSQAKNLKDPIKQLTGLADGSEATTLIHELLNAEIYDMEPKKVFLLMERILISLELKRDHLIFGTEHRQSLKELSTKLSGGVDVEKLNKLFFLFEESPKPTLLGLMNRLNRTLEDRGRNVFHENDNTMLRECVLRSFAIPKDGLPREGSVDSENAQYLVALDYCVYIMIEFQHSFLMATRKVFELDAETRRSSDQSNALGIGKDRVSEMKNQCECILDKQVPISFALKQLELIWQTLESDKIVAKEAKLIASLQQKFDGNVPGGTSLAKRLGNNPDNVEMLKEYRLQAQKAYADFKNNMENIADQLRNLDKVESIPKHILQYQRQILGMERAIIQAVEELKSGDALRPELVKEQIQEKQQRIQKYKKVLAKYQKDNPSVKLPEIS